MIILKSEQGDFIYLDVVTQYSRSFASQVSSHPVDGAGVVTDHVTRQNPRIQLVGNITGADFNSSKPDLNADERAYLGIDQVIVSSDIAQQVKVSYEDSPLNLLPDSLGQFFSDTLPEVSGIVDGRDASYSEKILFSVLEKFYQNKRKLTLFEFDHDNKIVDTISNVFITSLNINESVSTGESLAFDITLEQVTFSYLLEEDIPEDVQAAFLKQAAEKANKGGESPVEEILGGGGTGDVDTTLFERVVGD